MAVYKYYIRNFAPHHYYHIYNRGAHKQNIFLNDQDYLTFTDIIRYYAINPLGKPLSHLDRYKLSNFQIPNMDMLPTYQLASYILMPNHYHFLIKQTLPPKPSNNISSFIQKIAITYAKFFNKKHNHSGTLFQGKFKNVLIETEPQLLYITKYIHTNAPNPLTYPYSSAKHYLNPKKSKKYWIFSQEILSFFSKTNPHLSYKTFLTSKKYQTDLSNLTLD